MEEERANGDEMGTQNLPLFLLTRTEESCRRENEEGMAQERDA